MNTPIPEAERDEQVQVRRDSGYLIVVQVIILYAAPCAYLSAVGATIYLAISYFQLLVLIRGQVNSNDIAWYEGRLQLLIGLAILDALFSISAIYYFVKQFGSRWFERRFFVSTPLLVILTAPLFGLTTTATTIGSNQWHYLSYLNCTSSIFTQVFIFRNGSTYCDAGIFVSHLSTIARNLLILMPSILLCALIWFPSLKTVRGSKLWRWALVSYLLETLLDDIIFGVTCPIWLLIDISIGIVSCVTCMDREKNGNREISLSWAFVTLRSENMDWQADHFFKETYYAVRYKAYEWWVSCGGRRLTRKRQLSVEEIELGNVEEGPADGGTRGDDRYRLETAASH